jgi:hypothetical protein
VNKKVLSLLLAVALFSAMPMVSLAANETEMNTSVSYTKIEETATEPETPSNPTPKPATYEINIPASISLNDTQELNITSSSINIPDGKTVVVEVNGKTFESDGYLYLKNSGPDKIGVELLRLNTESGQVDKVGNMSPVAFFNNKSTTPSVYGLMYVRAFSGDIKAAQPGTYHGSIYFNIRIIDY